MKSVRMKCAEFVSFFTLFLLFVGGTPQAARAEASETLPATSASPTTAVVPTGPVLERWGAAVKARLDSIDVAAPPPAPPVGAGPSLKLGAAGERVERLAAQLIARGFAPKDTGQGGQFDAALELAVRSYQTTEGLPADGVAGATTIEALDRTAAANAAALKDVLEQMRALAAHAPREFFLVNIPSQTAYLIQGDKIALSMRVAVGRPSRPTPTLNDQITDVILNPTWTAPTTVLAKDKLPALRKNGHPGIEGATIYLDGLEVDPATVDWSAVGPERLRIVQSPGNQNALGRFKFNLTNGESIYLHDTNDHSVFARQNRAISSGCVRLAEPRRLAETLLSREGWTPDKISHAVDAAHTRAIGLSHPLPVRIVYWQAAVEDDGAVRVLRDVYGTSGTARTQTATKPAPERRSDEPAAGTRPVVQVGEVAASTPTAARRPAATLCDGNCGWGLY